MFQYLSFLLEESSIKDINGLRNTGVGAERLDSLHRLFHQKINRKKELGTRIQRDPSLISPLG